MLYHDVHTQSHSRTSLAKLPSFRTPCFFSPYTTQSKQEQHEIKSLHPQIYKKDGRIAEASNMFSDQVVKMGSFYSYSLWIPMTTDRLVSYHLYVL